MLAVVLCRRIHRPLLGSRYIFLMRLRPLHRLQSRWGLHCLSAVPALMVPRPVRLGNACTACSLYRHLNVSYPRWLRLHKGRILLVWCPCRNDDLGL